MGVLRRERSYESVIGRYMCQGLLHFRFLTRRIDISDDDMDGAGGADPQAPTMCSGSCTGFRDIYPGRIRAPY